MVWVILIKFSYSKRGTEAFHNVDFMLIQCFLHLFRLCDVSEWHRLKLGVALN